MKKAMSLIELVFAIVVMGIAVMSLPLILTQVQNNNSFALRQEAIFSVKTKLAYILAYQWDQNTYDATANIERVLNTTASANADTDFNTSTTRRKGHVLADERRRLGDNLAISPTPKANFGTGGIPADIDDFDAKSETKAIVALDDFIFDLNLTTTVNYLLDSPSAGTTYANNAITFIFNPDNVSALTNIKMIKVTATANGIDAPISMYAFSSNIGQSKIAKRAW